MARMARIVVPDYPHHIIQRGNRRQKVFFNEGDYREYLRLLGEYSQKFNLDILTYCLMPNHIHIIAIPHKKTDLAQAIGETHRNYTRFINFRENWRGYLWQGRFSSYILDEKYLITATRYILLNPVRANIVRKPWDYEWSSAKHHMGIAHNPIIKDSLLKELIKDWEDFLAVNPDANSIKLLEAHERTGRPLGNNTFIEKLESILGMNLKKKNPGRKKKEEKIGIVSPD